MSPNDSDNMRKDFFYTPNHIPAEERTKNILSSIALFLYGSYGVYVNDLYIPGKRSKGIHLHDVPCWIMFGAIICACLVMLSVVVDHYDQRNNENELPVVCQYIPRTWLGIFCGLTHYGDYQIIVNR